MANDENLKPFPPGVSGNPSGRPKGSKNFKTLCASILSGKLPDAFLDGVQLPRGLTGGQAVVYHLLQDAMNCNVAASRELIRLAGDQTIHIDDDDVDACDDSAISPKYSEDTVRIA